MSSRAAEREKITVSLPRELIHYADQRAAALGKTRSQIIGEAVAGLRAKDEEDLAREGYMFYAEEAATFAASSLRAVSEAIEHTDG
jgi:metal-responsive CopG/Arc/MetJ family transcriptional regulator